MPSSYTGVVDIKLSDDQLEQIKGKRTIDNIFDLDLVANQYIAIKDINDNYINKFKYNGKKITKLNYKEVNNIYVKDISPRNIKQEMVFDLLQNDEIPVKLITGSMGSGKTFLTLTHALEKISNHSDIFKKIVYIRNNIEVKDTEKIGALPDGVRQKLAPFIMPIYDCLEEPDMVEQLERKNKIEFVHLGHIRGRSWSNAVIIVSESENLTRDHVKLLIGRVGENSIIVFEGDLSQTDKKTFEINNGIKAMREILKGNQLFGAVEMDKSERSKVAELSRLF